MSQSDPMHTDPHSAAGQTAPWKYKASHRLGDEPAGQWSDIVSQAVAG